MSFKYKNLKVMLTGSDSTGCGYFRSYLPTEFLKNHIDWVEHHYGFPANDPRLMEADVIGIQRATHEYFFDWIPMVQSLGKKVIYDLDDNIHNIPAANLAHNKYPGRELKKLEKIVRLCDAVTCSTVPMKNYLQRIAPDKEIFIIGNHIFHDEIEEKPKNEKIKIGWAGSYTHSGDFTPQLVNALRDTKKKYQDLVEISVFGYKPQWSVGLCNYVKWAETTKYHDILKEQNYDIGIIVAADNEFNRCKSNLKFIEYGSIRCAPIAHSVYPYINSMEHGVDSFLVKNEKTEWKEYLTYLIENPEKRLEMANNAYEKVKNNFTYSFNCVNILNTYEKLFDYLYGVK